MGIGLQQEDGNSNSKMAVAVVGRPTREAAKSVARTGGWRGLLEQGGGGRDVTMPKAKSWEEGAVRCYEVANATLDAGQRAIAVTKEEREMLI